MNDRTAAENGVLADIGYGAAWTLEFLTRELMDAQLTGSMSPILERLLDPFRLVRLHDEAARARELLEVPADDQLTHLRAVIAGTEDLDVEGLDDELLDVVASALAWQASHQWSMARARR